VRRGVLLACGVAAVIAAVAWGLHAHHSSVVGSNGIQPVAFASTIPPHGRVCDFAGTATSTVNAIQMTVGTAGKPSQPLQLTLSGVGASPVLRSYPDGVIDLRLPSGHRVAGGTACLHNLGTQPVFLAGETASASNGARVDGRPVAFHASFGLLSDHPPSWWSLGSSVSSRVGLGRGGAGGSWTGVLMIVLLAASLLGAVWTASAWR
jgi:hypothetical protein